MSHDAEPVFAVTTLGRIEEWLASYEQHQIDLATKGSIAIGKLQIGSPRELHAHRDRLERERTRLLAGGIAQRPLRSMPPLAHIAAYHNLGDRPWCLGCGWRVPMGTWAEASGLLERAHIIGRVFGGLDALANLAPLCSACHKAQPNFEPGDEAEALQWFGLPVTEAEVSRIR